jgi:hypothetical protein
VQVSGDGTSVTGNSIRGGVGTGVVATGGTGVRIAQNDIADNGRNGVIVLHRLRPHGLRQHDHRQR